MHYTPVVMKSPPAAYAAPDWYSHCASPAGIEEPWSCVSSLPDYMDHREFMADDHHRNSYETRRGPFDFGTKSVWQREAEDKENAEKKKKSKVKGPAREIQYLGIKWEDGRHQIPTDVMNKITAMSPSTNKKEIQAFLGAIGFWRMHIAEYSHIVSPLYLVTRKKNDFHWGPEQQHAFAQIYKEI